MRIIFIVGAGGHSVALAGRQGDGSISIWMIIIHNYLNSEEHNEK